MAHKVLANDSTATKKWLVSAKHNTWSHQRRKRRQMAQLASREKLDRLDNVDSHGCHDRLRQQEPDDCGDADSVVINGGHLDTRTVHSESCLSDQTPVTELINGDVSDIKCCVTTEKQCHVGATGTAGKCGGNKDTADRECLLKYTLVVSQQKDYVVLQFTWTDGVSYDLLHQVVQFFRNRLQ